MAKYHLKFQNRKVYMSLKIIAAIGKNNELGKDNKLLWNLKDDLKFFREKTNYQTIIMGRKTFESPPKLLPNRRHVVLSQSDNFPSEVIVYHQIQDLLENEQDGFIIGGGKIYTLLLNYANKLYLTEIDKTYKDADTYFPNFDKSLFETETLKTCYDEKEDIHYKHVLYKRR